LLSSRWAYGLMPVRFGHAEGSRASGRVSGRRARRHAPILWGVDARGTIFVQPAPLSACRLYQFEPPGRSASGTSFPRWRLVPPRVRDGRASGKRRGDARALGGARRPHVLTRFDAIGPDGPRQVFALAPPPSRGRMGIGRQRFLDYSGRGVVLWNPFGKQRQRFRPAVGSGAPSTGSRSINRRCERARCEAERVDTWLSKGLDGREWATGRSADRSQRGVRQSREMRRGGDGQAGYVPPGGDAPPAAAARVADSGSTGASGQRARTSAFTGRGGWSPRCSRRATRGLAQASRGDGTLVDGRGPHGVGDRTRGPTTCSFASGCSPAIRWRARRRTQQRCGRRARGLLLSGAGLVFATAGVVGARGGSGGSGLPRLSGPAPRVGPREPQRVRFSAQKTLARPHIRACHVRTSGALAHRLLRVALRTLGSRRPPPRNSTSPTLWHNEYAWWPSTSSPRGSGEITAARPASATRLGS